jgi:hypothetical protein
MTPEQLDQIEQRAAAAYRSVHLGPDDDEIPSKDMDEYWKPIVWGDWAMQAEEDVPALVAALRAAWADYEVLRAAFADIAATRQGDLMAIVAKLEARRSEDETLARTLRESLTR